MAAVIARDLHRADGSSRWGSGLDGGRRRNGRDAVLLDDPQSLQTASAVGVVECFGASVSVGNLAIQVYGSTPPIPTVVWHGSWAPYLTRVWPSAKPAKWPADRVLTGEDELDAFATSWLDKKYDLALP